ncbi:MAG: hypothetical protein K2K01_00100, partial [Eubacterium sp.]|nr:hypothetical protein [Eubacterium sp.]
MAEWFENLKSQFELNFISGDRWKLLAEGLGTTIKITVFAVILGVFLGIVIAVIRSSYDKNAANMHVTYTHLRAHEPPEQRGGGYGGRK